MVTLRETDAYIVAVDYLNGRVHTSLKVDHLSRNEAYSLGMALRDATLCLNNYDIAVKRSEERDARRRERYRRRFRLPNQKLSYDEGDNNE